MKASKTHAVVAFVFVFCASSCIAYGQVTRVPSLTNSKRAQPITTPASEPIGTDDLDDHEFSESVENTLQVWNTVLQLGKGEKLRHLNIAGTNEWGGNPTPEEGDPSPFFKYAVDSCHSGICHIAIGFVPTDDKTHTAVLQASLQGADGNEKQLRGELKGKGRSAGQTECLLPSSGLFPTLRLSFNVQGERKSAFWLLDQELAAEFGTWSGTKEEVINCYFQTSSSVSVFTQVQSIFNAASGSTTVAADIASLNFNNGTQLTLGTNVQAGSGGNSSTPAPSATATVPTLSSTSAAQAAQNLLWGGNLYVYGVLPIYFNPNAARDRWSLNDNLVVREGVDVQNFSGSSTTFNNPTTHFNFMTDGYWQYDAIPPLIRRQYLDRSSSVAGLGIVTPLKGITGVTDSTATTTRGSVNCRSASL